MLKRSYVNTSEDEDGYEIELVLDGYEYEITHTQDKSVRDQTIRNYQHKADEFNNSEKEVFVKKLNSVQKINKQIENYILKLEKDLDREFRETYSFWDSLFVVDTILRDNSINGLMISICEFKESGTFYLNPEGFWTCPDKMNSDYKETILKVLNKK